MIKEPPIEIDGRAMQPDEFISYVLSKDFGAEPPDTIFLHHTWRPTVDQWRGRDSILAMKAYYERQVWSDENGEEHEGWPAGPHLFVAEDGIWLFTDLARDGVGVRGQNHRSLHLEMVGDYDDALPSGKTWTNSVAALGVLHVRLGLDPKKLMFHRDFSTKSCPGNAVSKEWAIPQLEAWLSAFRAQRGLRSRVMAQAARLIYPHVNQDAALYQKSVALGLLGPLSDELTIDADGQQYIVQFFIDALVVPVGQWDQVKRLADG